MNEQLQKALVELINKASGGIDTSVSFLSAEIPDVVMQILMWQGVKSAIMFLFFFSCSILCIRSALKYNPDAEIEVLNAAYDRGDEWTRFMGNKSTSTTSHKYDALKAMARPQKYLRYIASFFMCLITLSNIEWLQILVAPKLYLIEYASSLVK